MGHSGPVGIQFGDEMKTLEKAAQPLMDWAKRNCNPHQCVVVTRTRATVSEEIPQVVRKTETAGRLVVGFVFRGKEVVLILKNRPDWQAGRLNGVGGRVEAGESPKEAMVREFKEETGLYIPLGFWMLSETIVFDNGVELSVFTSTISPGVQPASVTDEAVVVVSVTEVLKWTPHPMLLIQDKIKHALAVLGGKKPRHSESEFVI